MYVSEASRTLITVSWLKIDCVSSTFIFSKSEFVGNISAAVVKSRGEMGQPCLIPFMTENLRDVPKSKG